MIKNDENLKKVIKKSAFDAFILKKESQIERKAVFMLKYFDDDEANFS